MKNLNLFADRWKLAVSIHEAAHAVVGLVLGIGIKSVVVFPDSLDAAGITTFVDFDEVFASDRIKAMLAGLIAERRLGGTSWNDSSNDCAEVASILTNAGGLNLRDMVRGAADLVDKYWQQIETLAAALLDRQCLTGVEVVEIVGLGE